MTWALYQQATGRILQTVSAPLAVVPAGCAQAELAPGQRDDTHYVSEGVITPLPARPSDMHSWDWSTKAWTLTWAAVRERRDWLLAATDWVSVRAMERGEAVPADWATFRQALRDITLQDLASLTWPTPPAPVPRMAALTSGGSRVR